jgi:hypothetical protein
VILVGKEEIQGKASIMKFMTCLFLVLILSACQNSAVSELLTKSGEAYYRDDFSDPASGWPQADTENSTLGYREGTYQMLVKTSGYDVRTVSGNNFEDVQVEVDTSRLAGPSSNRFGLICHFQDMDNFYFFIISSDGYYAIGKLINGTAVLLGQDMMAFSTVIVQDAGPNHLRFDCIGNSLMGFVNGQAIAVTTDPEYSGGDAGFLTGSFEESGVEIGFDNFGVYKP